MIFWDNLYIYDTIRLTSSKLYIHTIELGGNSCNITIHIHIVDIIFVTLVHPMCSLVLSGVMSRQTETRGIFKYILDRLFESWNVPSFTMKESKEFEAKFCHAL